MADALSMAALEESFDLMDIDGTPFGAETSDDEIEERTRAKTTARTDRKYLRGLPISLLLKNTTKRVPWEHGDRVRMTAHLARYQLNPATCQTVHIDRLLEDLGIKEYCDAANEYRDVAVRKLGSAMRHILHRLQDKGSVRQNGDGEYVWREDTVTWGEDGWNGITQRKEKEGGCRKTPRRRERQRNDSSDEDPFDDGGAPSSELPQTFQNQFWSQSRAVPTTPESIPPPIPSSSPQLPRTVENHFMSGGLVSPSTPTSIREPSPVQQGLHFQSPTFETSYKTPTALPRSHARVASIQSQTPSSTASSSSPQIPERPHNITTPAFPDFQTPQFTQRTEPQSKQSWVSDWARRTETGISSPDPQSPSITVHPDDSASWRLMGRQTNVASALARQPPQVEQHRVQTAEILEPAAQIQAQPTVQRPAPRSVQQAKTQPVQQSFSDKFIAKRDGRCNITPRKALATPETSADLGQQIAKPNPVSQAGIHRTVAPPPPPSTLPPSPRTYNTPPQTRHNVLLAAISRDMRSPASPAPPTFHTPLNLGARTAAPHVVPYTPMRPQINSFSGRLTYTSPTSPLLRVGIQIPRSMPISPPATLSVAPSRPQARPTHAQKPTDTARLRELYKEILTLSFYVRTQKGLVSARELGEARKLLDACVAQAPPRNVRVLLMWMSAADSKNLSARLSAMRAI